MKKNMDFFHFRKFMHNQSKAKEIVIFNDKIITEIIFIGQELVWKSRLLLASLSTKKIK